MWRREVKCISRSSPPPGPVDHLSGVFLCPVVASVARRGWVRTFVAVRGVKPRFRARYRGTVIKAICAPFFVASLRSCSSSVGLRGRRGSPAPPAAGHAPWQKRPWHAPCASPSLRFGLPAAARLGCPRHRLPAFRRGVASAAKPPSLSPSPRRSLRSLAVGASAAPRVARHHCMAVKGKGLRPAARRHR
jgi:hypothetical protein